MTDRALSGGSAKRRYLPIHERDDEIGAREVPPHDAEQGSRDHGVVLGHQDPVHDRWRELRRLEPADGATWTAIDGRIDAVLSAIRDSQPDPETEKQALNDLLTALR